MDAFKVDISSIHIIFLSTIAIVRMDGSVRLTDKIMDAFKVGKYSFFFKFNDKAMFTILNEMDGKKDDI